MSNNVALYDKVMNFKRLGGIGFIHKGMNIAASGVVVQSAWKNIKRIGKAVDTYRNAKADGK